MIISIIGIISLTVIGIASIYSFATILLDGGFIAFRRTGLERSVQRTAERLTPSPARPEPDDVPGTEQSPDYAEAGHRG